MNKQLAGYLFAGETIFDIKTVDSAFHKSVTVESTVNPVVEPPMPVLITNIPNETSQKNAEDSANVFPSNKSLIIITNSLSESERDLLSKILISIKKHIENAEIIELTKIPHTRLSNYPSAKEIISFGIGMSKLGNDLLLYPYQSQQHQNVKYLLVDDLPAIQSNLKDEKRLLWAALKNMYQL
jgi:DNA polymerase III psi subunit